jgi:hypothetical protein
VRVPGTAAPAAVSSTAAPTTAKLATVAPVIGAPSAAAVLAARRRLPFGNALSEDGSDSLGEDDGFDFGRSRQLFAQKDPGGHGGGKWSISDDVKHWVGQLFAKTTTEKQPNKKTPPPRQGPQGGPATGGTDVAPPPEPCREASVNAFLDAVKSGIPALYDFFTGDEFPWIAHIECKPVTEALPKLPGLCSNGVDKWKGEHEDLDEKLNDQHVDVEAASDLLNKLECEMQKINSICSIITKPDACVDEGAFNATRDKFAGIRQQMDGSTSDHESLTDKEDVIGDRNVSLTMCNVSSADLASMASCKGNCSSLFNSSIVAGLIDPVSRVKDLYRTYSDCTNDSPFGSCKAPLLQPLTASSHAVLARALTNLVQFESLRCNNNLCRAWRAFAIQKLLHISYDYASDCGARDCSVFCDTLSAFELENVKNCNDAAGCSKAVARAKTYFAADLSMAFARDLNRNALDASLSSLSRSASEDGSDRNNASFAMFNYVMSAIGHGMGFNESDVSVVSSIMEPLRACDRQLCNRTEVEWARALRRAVVAASVFWLGNVTSILNACQNEACTSAAAVHVDAATRALAATSYQLPMPAFVAIEAVVLLLALAVLVSAFVLGAASEHGFYILLLAGLVATAVIRVTFYGVALIGWGVSTTGMYSELAVLLLDKLASIFFALSVLVFLYLWVKMVHEQIYPSKTVVVASSVAAIVLAVALTATSLAYVIFATTNTTFVSQFFGASFLDASDLVLSAFLLLAACGLLVYSLLTLRFVRGLSKDYVPKIQQQIAACRRMTLVIFALVLLFALRMALVYYAHFNGSVSVGLLIYYGLGALVPEAVGTVLILYVVFLVFWQHRSKIQESVREPLVYATSERDSLLLGYDY